MSNKLIKKYFNFSTRERNGLIVLFSILVVIITTRIIISNIDNKSSNNFKSYEDQINKFISSQQINNKPVDFFYFNPNTASQEDFENLGISVKGIKSIINYREKGGKFYKKEDFKKIYNITNEEYEILKDYIIIENNKQQNINKKTESILFAFDPNTVTKEELQRLGLKNRQIDNLLKYKEKGGKFKKNEDLLKIYGIDNETFKRLEPYIKIEDIDISVGNVIQPESIKEEILIIELNYASQAELQKLKGIGPAYSKRIVDYRDKLGGYVEIEQLLEVYGLSEELFNNIKENLIIDKNGIKRININSAEYKDLISHPYIDKDNANKILNYRKFAKEIKALDELLQQKAITQEFYNKINLYLTIE